MTTIKATEFEGRTNGRGAAGADWSELEERAAQARQPLLVQCRYHLDDRGWSLMNLLSGALSSSGQINCSTQLPGVVKAWHRHRLQTDFWICVAGHLKAGIYREDDGASWSVVLGERRPGVLVIPSGLWHGAATIGSDPAVLMYYVTRRYDAAHPDEERCPWDSIPGFDWVVQNR